MRQLIRNGKIYDGTGSEPFTGDILIEQDRIARIGGTIDVPVESVVDLHGLSVSPGFIDAHSHNDWFAIKKDPLPYFKPFLYQGITTFVTGNCGVSAVGFEDECPFMDRLGGGLFSFEDSIGPFGMPEGYFSAVDRHMPCNMALLVGHCSARAAAGGNENRKLTPEEEGKMLGILEKALQQGAAGISLGLMYEPGLYADAEELKKVARLCEKYNKPLTVHPRAESKVSMAYPQLFGRSHLLRAVDELAEISKGTKLKLQYSHAIFVGRKSFGAKEELLRMMDRMRAEGVDVMFDIYNECLGVSVITVILPAWYQGMSPEERRKPLNRLKLAALVKASAKLLGFGFPDIQVGDVISFFDPTRAKKEVVITHRVEGIEETESGRFFITKGDANNATDPVHVPESLLVGRYYRTIPFIGQAVLFMRTPIGIVVTVIIPLIGVIAYDLVRRRQYEKALKEQAASAVRNE